MVLKVTQANKSDIPRARDYLRGHFDTSLFLLSNLASYGHALGDAMNSGHFKLLCEDDRVQGVFCLTRRGNLLAECGGQTQFAPMIVDACRSESISIRGVVGEWRLADAIWQILVDSGSIAEVVHASREPLYRLLLNGVREAPRDARVRALQAHDFDAWEPLNTAYLHEEELPIQGSMDQRQSDFADGARAGRWWGLWERGELLAIGGLNAMHEHVGQVGGVYTVPRARRRGLASRLMRSLIRDCGQSLGLGKLILFTGENNAAAQGLYVSLGFERIGEFALLFGSPADVHV